MDLVNIERRILLGIRSSHARSGGCRRPISRFSNLESRTITPGDLHMEPFARFLVRGEDCDRFKASNSPPLSMPSPNYSTPFSGCLSHSCLWITPAFQWQSQRNMILPESNENLCPWRFKPRRDHATLFLIAPSHHGCRSAFLPTQPLLPYMPVA